MSLLLNRIAELGARFPEAEAISFVDDDGGVVESLSRAGVVAEMAAVADFLGRGGVEPGDRALLVFPPGLDFVRGLIGCMAAGVVAVPVYPPDPVNPHTTIEHLRRVAADCDATTVVTSCGYADARELGVAMSLEAGRAVEWPAELSWQVIPPPGQGCVPEGMSGWSPGPDTPALLQYTSGSTSDPKGVVITYGNLAHQFEFNRRYLGLGLGARGVFWVPGYHDFGLISGILSTLAGNFELTLMSPLSFVRRPAVWFEVMDRVRATHTVSPNFGFELAVRKTTAQQRAGWDLSSLTMVMSAAEPVREDTTGRFLEAFRVTGLRPEAFCPSYGLAEHTVGVSLWGRGSVRVDRGQLETQRLAVVTEGADAKVLMGCGALTDDVDVRIVDAETCVELGEGQVGEIWVDSPSKAWGYWGKPQDSRATFQARLAGEQDSGRGYLRTGDLGFVRDGQLYVCGRVKDLLIVAGRNIYPQDIEDSVRECHPVIRPGGIAAFSIEENDSEALAVLVEVATDTAAQVLSEVAAAVRAAVLRNHQLRCAVVAVAPPGGVSKTTSGKIQRARCRTRLLDGSLDTHALLVDRRHDEALMTPASKDVLQRSEPEAAGAPILGGGAHTVGQLVALVCEQVAAVLGIGVADIDISQPLGEQGLNSIGVTELATRLSQLLGVDVQPVDVFNHPTVEDLTRMLSRGEQPRDQQQPTHTGGRYAVIGAGAAGVAAAAQLIEQGAAEVVLFEANDRVGGKVWSYTDEQGRVVELGQAGFSWKYQHSLRMAGRLGLELIPSVPGLTRLRSGGGHEQLDLGVALLEATDWSRQVVAAAGIEGPSTLAELRGHPDLGCGIATWCRQHNLPAASFGVAAVVDRVRLRPLR